MTQRASIVSSDGFRALAGISLNECHGNGIRARVEPHDARARQQTCSLIRGQARERFYEILGGDDAGRRHFQRGGGFDVRLAGAHRGAVHDAQSRDAVGAAVFGEAFEVRYLLRVVDHHKLAAIPVRHMVRGAEFVQHPVARHAQARFERAGRIVDARMDHAAVARARAHAELGHLLDEKHVAPAPRNRARHGATHHAPADDHNVGAIHGKQNTGGWRLEARGLKQGGNEAGSGKNGNGNRKANGDNKRQDRNDGRFADQELQI